MKNTKSTVKNKAPKQSGETKIKFLTIAALICFVCACSGSKNKLTSFDKPQEYAGIVEFENSKNVEIRLMLSANAKQITGIKLTADELFLTPENADRQEKKQTGENAEITFAYTERTTAKTNIATSKDESGNPVVKDVIFTGGFASADTVELKGGKISLVAAPLIFDLTVTNACIYGKIKCELSGCGTQSVYAVLKNETTPQEMPAEILKGE
jgi:hypothetical protein